MAAALSGCVAGPTKVLFKAKTSSLPESPLTIVYKIGDSVYSNTVSWETLTKCTARGKNWLAEGAELIHIGGSYILEMNGRRKDKTLSPDTIKPRTVGGKGSKIANLTDTKL